MDRPKSEVSWLESFPPDIWAYLVFYLPGEQLGRLMMTGATFLWRRLKSPHVVKSIKLGRDFVIFDSVPRFLSEFPSLEVISIHSFGANWSHKLGLSFDSIPSGVRKLELSGDWRKSGKLFGSPGRALNISKHLPILETLNLNNLNIPDYALVTLSPRSLTRLNFGRWNGEVELPSSLIHFEATCVDLSTPSFVSKLPHSLESFVVTSKLLGVDLVVPLLPHSTRKLYLGREAKHSARPKSTQSLLEQLPKYLTCFQVPKDSEINFLTNIKVTSLLPSALTQLNIERELPCSAWPLLPQQLRKLKFCAPESLCTMVSKILDDDGTHHDIRSIPFDDLPRSITSLELSPFDSFLCGPPTSSNDSYFPPQLTSLKIPGIHLSPEAAKLLPPSLTHLEIGNLCERVCEHFPKSLKTLSSFKTILTPNLIKFLPQSLTFLQSSVFRQLGNWFDYNTGEKIEDCSKLSLYSIQEKCVSKSFDWKNCSPLPPSLTHFHLTDATQLGDTFLLHQHLPNLVNLSLGNSRFVSDLYIPLLSPYLTSLNLSSSSKISGKAFSFLPRCLTQLDLNNSESIVDSDIQQLPRSLKYAFLRSAVQLTRYCIPDLPPQLEKLFMEQNTKIPPSSSSQLPYPLRSSQFQDTRVKFANWEIVGGEVLVKKKGR